MANEKIAMPASALSSVQDLYDLINGKTTTTSGGTTTQTESSGISQESMNAMLKSALESNTGLAAISQGQRTAGGYSSATNRLLTNDLMTRTAGQIAQAAANKTTTISKPATTVTAGGASVKGVSKTAGFLAALNALEKTGVLESSKKWLGTDKSAGSGLGQSSFTGMQASGNEGMSIGNQYASYGAGASGAGTSADFNINDALYSNFSSPDAFGGADSFSGGVDSIANVGNVNDVAGYDWADQSLVDVGIDPSTTSNFASEQGDPLQFLYDMGLEFADGGLVGNHPKLRMADGGLVKKQLGSMVGAQSNVVIDPRRNLIGGGVSYNPDGTIAPGSSATPSGTYTGDSGGGMGGGFGGVDNVGNYVGNSESSGGGGRSFGMSDFNAASRGFAGVAGAFGNQDLATIGKAGAFLSSPMFQDMEGIVDRAMAGNTTRSDVGRTSATLGSLASLTGNKDLGTLSQIGGIASAKTPAQAAMVAANIATGGLAGKGKGLYEGITRGNLALTANTVASLNPLSAAYNAIAIGLGGSSIGNSLAAAIANAQEGDPLDNFLSLIGEGVKNAPVSNQPAQPAAPVANANPNANLGVGEMSPDNQAYTEQANAMPGDALDNLMSITDAFGTANTTPDTPAYDTGVSSGDTSAGDTSGASVDSGYDGSGYNGYADGGIVKSNMRANSPGEVQGPGSSTSDSVHAKLSRNEYVLPADVVDIVGVDKLDALVKKYHVPAEVQKLRNFARA